MSYLELVNRLEARQTEYRDALRRWWTSPDDTEAYQRLLYLVDDLGVAQADAIRDGERAAWEAEPPSLGGDSDRPSDGIGGLRSCS